MKNSLLAKIGLVVFVLVFIGGIFSVYMKRGIQGRVKFAADDIGAQYAAAPMVMSEMRQAGSFDMVAASSGILPQQSFRKVITRAEINLEIKDAQQTFKDINALVTSVQGVILDAQINEGTLNQKSGRSMFKVVPEHFDRVMGELRRLGRVEYENVSGEDVTEEFVDLEARLSNSKKVRERLTKILEDKARNVKDILEVERELARVGSGIEVLEGRMKYLNRQTQMATITVNYHEPTVYLAPTLDIKEKIKEALKRSVETIVDVFVASLIFMAALVPIALWIVIITVVFFLIRGVIRKMTKKS